MLSLDEWATIENSVQEELDLVAEASRKKEWGRRTNAVTAFKRAVMNHGKAVQTNKCVWCEAKVGIEGRRTPHRDHIAPKDLYEKWTFSPNNIAISCEYCNGFSVKKDLDTIEIETANYEDCTFWIVHPYFDEPDEHIGFVEENGKVVMIGLSDKGLWTIKNMKLDGTTATTQRAFDRVLENIDLTDQDAILLRQAMDAMD